MKNTNLVLTIVLIALIAVILIAGIALIVVLDDDADSTTAVQTTTGAVILQTTPGNTTPWVPPFVTPAPATTQAPSTTPTPATTTAPPVTTQPTPSVTTTVPPTTTTQKVPEVSTPATSPEGTTPPATTEAPVTTTKPVTPPPTPESTSGTVEGEKVGSLGLYASYTTEVDPTSNTVAVKVTFYVESYALRIGARNDNYLMINGEKLGRLSNEAISLPDKSPLTRTVLYEYETVVQLDGHENRSLELEFFWHFQATYSGIHKDWLSVKVDLTF